MLQPVMYSASGMLGLVAALSASCSASSMLSCLQQRLNLKPRGLVGCMYLAAETAHQGPHAPGPRGLRAASAGGCRAGRARRGRVLQERRENQRSRWEIKGATYETRNYYSTLKISFRLVPVPHNLGFDPRLEFLCIDYSYFIVI